MVRFAKLIGGAVIVMGVVCAASDYAFGDQCAGDPVFIFSDKRDEVGLERARAKAKAAQVTKSAENEVASGEAKCLTLLKAALDDSAVNSVKK